MRRTAWWSVPLLAVAALAVAALPSPAAPESRPLPRALQGVARLDGAPIAGGRVRVVGAELPLASTDAEGRFSFEDLPARELAVELHVPTAGGFSRVASRTIDAGATSLDFDVAVPSLTVVARWPDGSPGFNFRVEVTPLREGAGPGPTAWGVTLPDGRATLRVEAPGRHRVIAELYGFGRMAAEVDVVAPAGEPAVELALEAQPCVVCKGRVELEGERASSGGYRRFFLRPVKPESETVREASMYCWIGQGKDAFEMPNVVPGLYVALMLGGGGETWQSEPFRIGRDGASELVLALRKRGS